ncbi:MAG TPA: tetratricopeptide repeat protein [Candidatus Cloacimonadota bacterium]|nr:tetratricopeptide repeat protein [Candidatus Cloacimonadota bacterium]
MKKLIIAVIVLALALGACSQARQKLTPQGNVDFKTAQVYYSQQNVERAEEYYTKVLADNPEHAISLRRMADINLHKGENFPARAVEFNKNAFEMYTKAIKITEAYENLTDDERLDLRDMKKRKESTWARIFKAGETAITDGNTKEAMDIFELAHTLEPSRPEPMIRLKDIYMNELKDDAKAEEILLSLLKDDPDKLPYLLETGAFYYNKANYTEAAKYFERVKTQTPTNIDNLLNLSSAYYELKDYDKALEVTRLAMDLDPSNIDLVDNAKNIALMKGDKELAITYLAQLIERRSTEDDFNDIAALLNEKQDFLELIKYAEKWYQWDNSNKFAIQYVILGAIQTKNKTLQTKYENILKNIK